MEGGGVREGRWREGGVRERGGSEVGSSSVGTHRLWACIGCGWGVIVIHRRVLVVDGGVVVIHRCTSSMGTYCSWVGGSCHSWALVICGGRSLLSMSGALSSVGGGEGHCHLHGRGPVRKCWVWLVGPRYLGVVRGCWVPFVGTGHRLWVLGLLCMWCMLFYCVGSLLGMGLLLGLWCLSERMTTKDNFWSMFVIWFPHR